MHFFLKGAEPGGFPRFRPGLPALASLTASLVTVPHTVVRYVEMAGLENLVPGFLTTSAEAAS